MSDGAKPISTAGALGAGLGRVLRVLFRPARGPAPQTAADGDAARRSTAAALGAGAGRTVRQSRNVFRGLRAGAGTFLGRLWHVLGVLFLEVMGLIFLVFGTAMAGLAWVEYRAFRAGEHGPARYQLAIGLAAMFLYFGISSFWRSHRKARR